MVFLSMLAGVVAALGAAGAYFRILSPIFATYLCLGGVAVIAVSLPVNLVRFIRFGKRRVSFVSMLFGIVAVGALAFLFKLAIENPINDIATDPAQPVPFSHPSSLISAPGMQEFVDSSFNLNKDYKPEFAEKQKRAYPDIHPVALPLDPGSAYGLVDQIVKQQHPEWRVVSENPGEGKIEVEAETPYFHFVDDLVIQVEPSGDNSRVQIRSRSRFGQSDLGMNARRIRALMTELKGQGAAPAAPAPQTPAPAPAPAGQG
jgi:uncharacterized protein (DUF1499 family)